jgi:hypothetical protein
MPAPFYLGPPNRLFALQAPLRGIEVSPVRAGGTRRLLSGGAAADTLGRRRRQFTMSWTWLPDAVFATLEGLATGVYGPGPFLLVDPARRNLLPDNIAAPTSPRADTFGWGVSAGTLASVATPTPLAGRRVISWSPGTTAAGNAVLFGVDAARILADAAPAIQGVQYTAQGQNRLVSGTGTTAMRLGWYTAAGTLASSTSGTSAALSTSAWTRQSATGSPPATGLYVMPALEIPAGGAGQVVACDAWQLELGGSATDWTRGTGTPRVMIDQLTDSYPLVGHHDVTLTLVEV